MLVLFFILLCITLLCIRNVAGNTEMTLRYRHLDSQAKMCITSQGATCRKKISFLLRIEALDTPLHVGEKLACLARLCL